MKVSKLALTNHLIHVNNNNKACCVNGVVNMKPIYLNKHVSSCVSFKIIKGN